MATITKQLDVGINKELLVDCRNSQHPFKKHFFEYCHKYLVASNDYAAGDTLVIQFVGAQKILHCDLKEKVTTTTNIAFTEASITSPQGWQVTTAATNGASVHLLVRVVVEV